MGKKSSPPAPEPIRVPSPAEIGAQQLENTRGLLDLQLEKFPEFTQAEIERTRALAPETAQAIVDAQGVALRGIQEQFPEFFDVLKSLGAEAQNRLQNIGQLPSNVAQQAIELSRADQAQRGIVDSPLAVAGTAGQLAGLAQAQRAQDLGLASQFLTSPFAPNLPLTGTQGAGQISSPSLLQGLQPANALQSFGLQADIGFSNAALQRSNALLGQGGSGKGGAIGAGFGTAIGAGIGTLIAPGVGTAIGGAIGGGLGQGVGGFF